MCVLSRPQRTSTAAVGRPAGLSSQRPTPDSVDDGRLLADREWTHLTFAGVESCSVVEYEQRGIALTNRRALQGDSIGDTALGMLLLARASTTTSRTRQTTTGSSRSGTPARAGRRARLRRRPPALRRAVPGVDDLYHPETLDAAIEDARFVVLCIPLTDETEEIHRESEFKSMREDASLVNVARGGHRPGRTRRRARPGCDRRGPLDVFETEPLSAESPLGTSTTSSSRPTPPPPTEPSPATSRRSSARTSWGSTRGTH
ncbi:NAD(P)-dependent oxidoreductase [Halolamina sp.]|uniref:NAD(P)-dependent oxidoreductase n=1 Tax=Halolamina sp. TaxID=1940283 RepID=UPI000223B77D|nr:D-isomer specific 2-hydroxyacid dehydrogenase NAD-binding protein [halophilic archaeon DL31]